jgi:isopenicillin N synthase-like dioxygenase
VDESYSDELKKNGFCLHKITGAAQQGLDESIAAAFRFFRLPTKDKNTNTFPEEMGYRPIGVEYSQSPAYPDQLESFSVNPRISSSLSALPSEAARDLCGRMLATYDVLESLVETIILHLASTIAGQSIGSNLRGAFHSWSRLQINYSRPAEVLLPHINEAHEDGDLMTIAWASGPGLEIQMLDGSFNPLTTGRGEMLVMPGEILWLLSGGQVRPLYHRVRPFGRQTERIAVLFFADIDPMLCQPWVINEINKNADIKLRVLTSVHRFGLKGFASD